MNAYSLVTPPTALPVTLNEVKAHCRIEGTADDGYLQSLIFQATAEAENITRRKLVSQTWKYYLQRWPDGDYIELPFGRLQSVTSIKYRDDENTEYTFDTDEWSADTSRDPGLVYLESGYSWPSETLLPSSPIYIEFVCGYGAHAYQTITAATNASPIVLTVGTHGRTTGNVVLVESVGGNTAANGYWIMTSVTGDTLSLNGSTGNAAYTAGGKLIHITVPEGIRNAIKKMVVTAYDSRHGDVNVDDTIMRLLWSYRIRMF